MYIRAGCVRIRLRSQCTRLAVFVSLDFLRESLVSDPLADVDCHDDGTPDAAKMMLQWVQLHRWWFGGNGAIELWDTATGTRMARVFLAVTPSRTGAAFRRSWLDHSYGVRTCWRRSDPCEGKFGAYALHSPGAPSNSRRSVLRLRGSIGDEGRRLAESRQLGRGGAVRLLALSNNPDLRRGYLQIFIAGILFEPATSPL